MLYKSLTGPKPAFHELKQLFIELYFKSNKTVNKIEMLLVGGGGVSEEGRIPAEVEDVVELDEAVVVDPEDAIVVRGRLLRIVVE